MPRALVLSGPHGLGHTMPARSFRALFQEAGWTVSAFDSMSLLGRAQRAGQGVFTALMTIPGAYDGLHFRHLRTGSALARAMDSAATARAARALRAELAHEPADAIISVFATGAGAAARLKAEATLAAGIPPPLPHTVVFCPDVAAHRLWVHEGTDLFLVTSQAAAASVRRFLPRAPVAVVPPPVRAAFYAAPSRDEARQRLGIPAGARCALLIDSGWALAPVAKAAAALADAGVYVLAVAGRNRRLERDLRAAAASRERFTPFGFTGEVPALMAAADLVVSLPGATTCSEARVVGRPLLLLDVMPGHGRDNLLHELEQGGARCCGPGATDIRRAALAMLDTRADGTTAADSNILGAGAVAGQNRRPPRWEPAYVAALARIGLDLRTKQEDSTPGQDAKPGREGRKENAYPLP